MQVSQRDHSDSLGIFPAFFFGKPSSSTERKDFSHFSQNTASMWWFHIYFYFHPYLGKWSNLINMFQMGWNHQLGRHFCRTRTHGCLWQSFFCWTKQSYRNRLNQTSPRMSSFVWPFLFCWCRPSGQFMGWRSNICYGLINVRLRVSGWTNCLLNLNSKFYEGVWGGVEIMIWLLKWWYEQKLFMLTHMMNTWRWWMIRWWMMWWWTWWMHEMEMMNNDMMDNGEDEWWDGDEKWYVDMIGQFAHMNPP